MDNAEKILVGTIITLERHADAGLEVEGAVLLTYCGPQPPGVPEGAVMVLGQVPESLLEPFRRIGETVPSPHFLNVLRGGNSGGVS